MSDQSPDTPTEKYPHGQHPNSLKALKPFSKGDKRINRKGRPPGKTVSQLLREVHEDKRRALIKRMYQKALRGDVKAAEWIAKYERFGASAVLETEDFTITIERDRPEEDDEEDENDEGSE